MPIAASRLQTLPPYAFAVLSQRIREMAAEGKDMIRLDIGSPDMPPPAAVIGKLQESAARPDRHGYAGYKGTPDFRQAVARYYQDRFGVEVNPETEILPLMGSKEGIVNLSLAYLDRGDAAIVPDIGYPSYSMGARLAGGDICWIPVPEENGYRPDFAALASESFSNARLFWINYPNNPTGATADLDFYQQAVQFCAERDILLVSDNPYVDVTFDGYVAGSALQADLKKEHTVEFVSFSKTHNMAGWRLGAAVGNARAIANLLNIKSNMDSGHFHAIYDAGITALTTPQSWINERNAIYARRRDRILAALPEIGLSAQKPRGSLYVWAKVAQGDGTQYAEDVLVKTGVCLAPGAIYGPGGEKFVRFSTGIEDHRLDEALDRMRTWYQQR